MNSWRNDFVGAMDRERKRQDEKWGFPQEHSKIEWSGIIAEECGELVKELNDAQVAYGKQEPPNEVAARIYEEAVHTAAVASEIVEHMERGLL